MTTLARIRTYGPWCVLASASMCAAAADFDTAPQALLAAAQTHAAPADITVTGDTYPAFPQRAADHPALLPQNAAPSIQYLDITRWMTPDRPSSLGLSLGLALPSSTTAPQQTTLDLGVRWRSRLNSGYHLDVSAWARAPQNVQTPDAMGLIWLAQQPTYGTRMEVRWSSSRTRGLVPEFGAIGLQLEGGSRLVLRAKRGGPMLYYRAKF